MTGSPARLVWCLALVLPGCLVRAPSLRASAIAFADGGSAIVVAADAGRIGIYATETMAPRWERHHDRGAISDVYLSASGAYVALIGRDYRLQVIEIATDRDVLAADRRKDEIDSLRMSADERELVVVRALEPCNVELVDLATGRGRSAPKEAIAELLLWSRRSRVGLGRCSIPLPNGGWEHGRHVEPPPRWLAEAPERETFEDEAFTRFSGEDRAYVVKRDGAIWALAAAGGPAAQIGSIGRRQKWSRNLFSEGASVDWIRPARFSGDGRWLLYATEKETGKDDPANQYRFFKLPR